MGMYGRHLKGPNNGTDIDCSVYKSDFDFELDGKPNPSMTKQAERDTSDINKIIKQFERTGMVTHLRKSEPYYADISELGDYYESLNKVKKAEELFYDLDAEIRGRFDNDPGKLLEFLSDDKNRDEAVKLGIVAETKAEVNVEKEAKV